MCLISFISAIPTTLRPHPEEVVHVELLVACRDILELVDLNLASSKFKLGIFLEW